MCEIFISLKGREWNPENEKRTFNLKIFAFLSKKNRKCYKSWFKTVGKNFGWEWRNNNQYILESDPFSAQKNRFTKGFPFFINYLSKGFNRHIKKKLLHTFKKTRTMVTTRRRGKAFKLTKNNLRPHYPICSHV